MKKYLAETVGTFVLVFAGTGAIVVGDLMPGTISPSGVALTFGFAITAMIYSIGNISGAHLNPAVTISFWFSGRLEFREVLPYGIGQLAGALGASGLLHMMFPEHSTLGATLPAESLRQSLVMELVLGFILMFVILNVSTGAKEKGIMAGVAVGATIAMGALFAGPVSGASMNPARSIGPALVSGYWEHLWIYLVGPVVGALLASPFCQWIQGDSCCRTLAK